MSSIQKVSLRGAGFDTTHVNQIATRENHFERLELLNNNSISALCSSVSPEPETIDAPALELLIEVSFP